MVKLGILLGLLNMADLTDLEKWKKQLESLRGTSSDSVPYGPESDPKIEDIEKTVIPPVEEIVSRNKMKEVYPELGEQFPEIGEEGFRKIGALESLHNQYAENPSPGSSAKGGFQFIDGTARKLRKQIEERGESLPEDIFDIKTQKGLMEELTRQNLDALNKRGIEPSVEALYSLHNAGERKGLDLMELEDDEPVSEVMTEEQMKLNPAIYLKDGKPVTGSEFRENVRNLLNQRDEAAKGNLEDKTNLRENYIMRPIPKSEAENMYKKEEEETQKEALAKSMIEAEEMAKENNRTPSSEQREPIGKASDAVDTSELEKFLEENDPDEEGQESDEKSKLEKLLEQVREIGSDRKRQNTINAIGQIAAGLSNAAYGQAGQSGYGFAGGPIKAQKIDVGSDDRLKDILAQYKILGGGKDGTKRFQTSSGVVEIDKEGNVKELYRDPYRMGRLEQGERRIGQSGERLELQKKKQDWREQEKDELSDAQIKSINNVDQTLDKLDKLEGMKKEFSTGPLTGRINSIARYLGQADGNKTAMAAQIGDILSEYARSISGSAIAKEEFDRLKEQLPEETDSDEQFAAKLARFKDNMEDSRLRVLDNFKRQGKNIENLKERKSIEDLRKEYKSEKQEQSVVRRKTKDGRVALFDAETKEFIKYEDE